MIQHDGEPYKVLDFHTHFAGDPTKFDVILATIFARLQPRQPFIQRDVGRDPGALLAYLDRAGVDQVCVLAEEGPPTNYSVDSGFCAGYAAQAPDRLFAIGNVNPGLETDVARRCRQLIHAGVRGFKMYYADHNQDPYDSKLTPLYDLCQEYRLPLLIHSGTASRYPMSNPRYGEPLLFEALLQRYPDLPVVFCHGGKGGQHHDCLRLLQDYSNAFIDISDMAPKILREICTDAVADRFLFATDMPQFPDYKPLIDTVLALPLTVASRQRILYSNGAQLLGLPTA